MRSSANKPFVAIVADAPQSQGQRSLAEMKQKERCLGPLGWIIVATICCGGCVAQHPRVERSQDGVKPVSNAQNEYEVRGEVLRPGRYLCCRDLGLFAAIARAGRYTEHGDINHLRLIRNGQTTVLDMKGVEAGTIQQPIILPGDIAEIPKKEKS